MYNVCHFLHVRRIHKIVTALNIRRKGGILTHVHVRHTTNAHGCIEQFLSSGLNCDGLESDRDGVPRFHGETDETKALDRERARCSMA